MINSICHSWIQGGPFVGNFVDYLGNHWSIIGAQLFHKKIKMHDLATYKEPIIQQITKKAGYFLSKNHYRNRSTSESSVIW